MQVRTFFEILRRYWIAIVAIVLICTGIVAGLAYTATPLYRSSAKAYFSLVNGSTPNALSQGTAYTQNLVLTYAAVATTPLVLDPVIASQNLHLSASQLAGKINSTVTPNTVLVTISVSDPSPTRAADIANAVANQLGTAVRGLAPKDSKGNSTVTVTTVGKAPVPKAPSSPKKKRNIIAGFVGGILLGIVFAMMREMWVTQVKPRWRSENLTDAPVLGEIVSSSDYLAAPSEPVTVDWPQASAVFRSMYSNLEFLAVDRRPLSVIVTSALPKEGKSAVALNLAIASAEGGARTLLLDADLRDPGLAQSIGRPIGPGLSSILVGRVTVGEVAVRMGPNLDVVLAGPTPPNPSYLLASQSMARFLREASDRYDVILIDCAPVLSNGDTASLVGQTSGILLVTRPDRPSRLFKRRGGAGGAHIQEALEVIEGKGTLIGLILNRAPQKFASTHEDLQSLLSGSVPVGPQRV